MTSTFRNIVKLIEQQASASPEAPALRFDGRDFTRAELNARANQLAHWLIGRGFLPGSTAALLFSPGLDIAIVLLAIQKAGGTYVPVDPALPPQRQSHMVEEAGATVVIGGFRGDSAGDHEARMWSRPGGHWFTDVTAEAQSIAGQPATNPDIPVSADDLLCILYTSGSTGTPKGVELTNANVLNCLEWLQAQYQLTPADVVLHKTPYSFDVSMYELFWPLMAGASVCIARPEDHKDPAQLVELIRSEAITCAHFVPSMLAALIEEPGFAGCGSLKQLFVAGEALPYPLTRRCFAKLPDCRLHNLYGPTEAGVVSHWTCWPEDTRELVPIGFPVANTTLHVLADDGAPLAPGDEGELYIGGVQVAAGYRRQPELTANAFVNHPRLGRLYRTGDRVRQLKDGALVFVGRRDFQVKIRGLRVELGEIEAQINSHPGIVESVAGVHEPSPGDQRLVAWFQCRNSGPTAAELRAYLGERLPEPLLPQYLLRISSLPHLSNGKIDRGSLPPPGQQLVRESARPYVAPVSGLEKWLQGIWAEVLGSTGIGVDDRFFESGGTSLHALAVMERVREDLGVRLPLTKFYSQPTIASFASMLERDHAAAATRITEGRPASPRGSRQAPRNRSEIPPKSGRHDDDPVAIIGLACRVPGANSLEDFWQLLAAGREGIHDLDDAALDAAGIPADIREDPAYVRRTGSIADAAAFDATFFGYTPREAALTDPQQRVLLESAWHALEDAGVVPGPDTVIGAYVGIAHNNYFDQNLASYDELRVGDHGFQVLLGSDKDYAATRIAYKLDLRGPALTVQTACSTSGVALHLACQAIHTGDCDVAIVGGARINVPLTAGYLYVEGGPLARDGRVRPFDARASGMVLSSGVASLVLKRLSTAITDGNRVYALVRGTAINNDGNDKVGFTAPSERGQVSVIQAALAAAGVSAASVGYVEAHGTGTPTGDPIEVAALGTAYAEAERVALGSVKGNIGHLDAGAGAISVVKVAMALHRQQLLPSIHCDELNPECGLTDTPFFINTVKRPWPSLGPRRAAVSSFGFGGTNFHGVFEEGPVQQSSAPRRNWSLLRLSARTDADLRSQARSLGTFLKDTPDISLADVAWTLDVGRGRLPMRTFVVARRALEASSRLLSDSPLIAGSPGGTPPGVVYLFPGQGAQHANMGLELYEQEPVFRAAIERCAAILKTTLGMDLRLLLYPTGADAAQAGEALRATGLAQPAIFTISYATACLWASWGLTPKAMIGHSLGEFVAATLAGVFELEHALLIVSERSRLMQSMPGGGMLAVQLCEEEAGPYLGNGVALAAVNSPNLVVLSGPHPALRSVEESMQEQSIGTTRLQTSHAFHSSMMDSVLDPLADFIGRFPLAEPQIPIVSTVTGNWLTTNEVRQPGYWARQLRGTVRFAAAVDTVLDEAGSVVFLEVGPGHNLTTATRQTVRPDRGALAIASLPHAGRESASPLEHLLGAAGKLYMAGVELDPEKFYAGESRLTTSLPGYPFARVTHWIAPLSSPSRVKPMAPMAELAHSPQKGDQPGSLPGQDATSTLLRQIIQERSGIALDQADWKRTFLDLGFDSLLLTVLATRIRQGFNVNMQFRQMLQDLDTPAALAAYLAANSAGPVPAAAPPGPAAADWTVLPPSTPVPSNFGASVRISRGRNDQLATGQTEAVSRLVQRTNARTPGSKTSAQSHRKYLADPRTVSGFRLPWKELVYPIVSVRSSGPFLWDVDGNQYIDTINGFGATLFGHSPEFVNAAVRNQLERGYEVGPIQDFIGEAAERFTRLTKLDRVAFCNTGSEAVIAAVRCARTVTGHDLVATFTGDYHGIQDEVLVRAGADGRSLPAASGVPASHVANTLVLPYGEQASLEILRGRAHELAAIMVEPVQGRRPALQPREFLHSCRKLATQAGCAFILDEVITGFRCAPGGAQEYFGVRADLATYGKTFGGGLPVGAVAGIPKFMDALDGGAWQFGDDSAPESGVTYFAGTFVRHPLVMAAVLATLKELEAQPDLQRRLNARVARFVEKLRDVLRSLRAPIRVATFSSLYRLEFTQEEPFGELLYAYIRERGIHAYDGRLGVMTVTHTDDILEQMLGVYRDSVAAMMRDRLLGRIGEPVVMGTDAADLGERWYLPPFDGARLCADRWGNPQWYRQAPASAGTSGQGDA